MQRTVNNLFSEIKDYKDVSCVIFSTCVAAVLHMSFESVANPQISLKSVLKDLSTQSIVQYPDSDCRIHEGIMLTDLDI